MAIRREGLGSAPRPPRLWRDPRVRAIAYQVLTLSGVVAVRRLHRQQHDGQPGPPGHRLGLRLPQQARRVRHPADADRVQRDVIELAGVLGRPAQHHPGRRGRHRARDRARLRDRPRAPVVQLAGGAARHRLHRDHPQHPVVAADPVLVLRGAAGPAAAPREPGFRRPVLPQQPRLLRPEADPRGRLRLGAPGRAGGGRAGRRASRAGQGGATRRPGSRSTRSTRARRC